MKAKRILIDARLSDGQAGGIQQVVCGIAQGLSGLDTSQFEIGFCVYQGESEWLTPYLAGHFRLIEINKPTVKASSTRLLGRGKNFIRRYFGHLLGSKSIRLEPEPELVTKYEPDLIHFVHQNCFATQRPYIFTPHDLQHEYFPEYFDKRTLMVRRERYKRHAQEAKAVACISNQCKKDVVRHLAVMPEKCPVIYNASPTLAYPQPSATYFMELRKKFDLPESFLYYPAKTYPHKNHEKLITAVKLLKELGEPVTVICSGPLTDHYASVLEPHIRSEGVESEMRFLGWVTAEEVNALYDMAEALIFPSRFEGFGIPLVEAMSLGLPVICSKCSSIPEVVGNAAVFFDPDIPDSIADSISQVRADDALRDSLSMNGRIESRRFSWVVSARQYVHLYHTILNET